jgi:hypothetical protein
MFRVFHVTLFVVTACGSDLPDKPVGPDMDALVAAYDTPTAELDQGVADELAAEVRERLDVADRLAELDEFIIETLEDGFGDQEAQDATPRRREGEEPTIRLEGDGFARLERICGGWGAEPEVDDDNGVLTLTTTFSEAGLDPVVWGELDECQDVLEAFEVQADGEVNLHIGRNLALEQVGRTPVLLQIVGAVDVDGERLVDGEFDVRVCPPGAEVCRPLDVELLVVRDDGTHLNFVVNLEARDAATVRAANGEWECAIDPTGATCTQGGESVTFQGVTP